MKIKKSVIGGLIAIGLLSSALQNSFAEDLGVWGQTWPVAEPDLLDFIQDRLMQLQQSGQLENLAKVGQQQAKQALLNPPLIALPTSRQDRVTYTRPVATLTHDVWLNVQAHYAAGTKVYPLDAVKLHETLIFIDGRSDKQLACAKCEASHYPTVKIILTGGNIPHAIKMLGRVYYDQNGMITSRLPIPAIPAVVNQVGNQLKIHQFNSMTLSSACVSTHLKMKKAVAS